MNDFTALVSSLAQEARTDAGAEHMDESTLFDYHVGGLDPALEERWREHLVSCPQCTAKLLELEPLAVPELPPESSVVDFELMASWKELQSRIEPSESKARPPRSWRLGAAAAALLMFSAGLTLDDLRLRREQRILLATQPNPTVVAIGLGLFRDGELPESKLAAGDPFFMLECSLPLDYRQEQATYELRLLTADGEERAKIGGLTHQAGLIRVRLHRDKLPPGEYLAQIYQLGGDQRQPLEYRFRLLHNP